MRVVDLKALMKERGSRGYSKLRKAELIALLQNNSPALCNRPTPGPQTRPPRPTSSPPPPLIDNRPSVRFRSDRPRQPELLRQLGERQPSSREMDVFEQQEMSKNRPQVTSKLNDWRDWLVNHVPKTIKDKASRAFKTFKDKIMGLFKGDNEREDQTPALRPYQLRPRRGKETFIEPHMKQEPPPSSNQKQIKHMKKKLGELNKKIRHSKKKHNKAKLDKEKDRRTERTMRT